MLKTINPSRDERKTASLFRYSSASKESPPPSPPAPINPLLDYVLATKPHRHGLPHIRICRRKSIDFRDRALRHRALYPRDRKSQSYSTTFSGDVTELLRNITRQHFFQLSSLNHLLRGGLNLVVFRAARRHVNALKGQQIGGRTQGYLTSHGISLVHCSFFFSFFLFYSLLFSSPPKSSFDIAARLCNWRHAYAFQQ